MKFLSVSILSLVGLAASAPAPVPQIPATGNVINPTAVSQYDVWTGAIRYASGAGKIFKNGKVTDTTTLLTFTYPAASAGHTCTIHLYLSSTSTLTGAANFDVFSSLQPATKSTSTWPPGNQRNNQLARMKAALGAEATFLSGYPLAAQAYPCPAAGTVAGYEFVPTDDTTDIEWTQSASVGAYITWV
jgi:Ubiquitin 3 binding protein But2 C-terminal domain